MAFGLEQEDGSFDNSHGASTSSIPLKAGRGISAETCGLDDVFPPDDLGSGPCTPFIIYSETACNDHLFNKIDYLWFIQ